MHAERQSTIDRIISEGGSIRDIHLALDNNYPDLKDEVLEITKSVSVVIPSYNSRSSLEKVLKSIGGSSFAQQYNDKLEVVVVDDGSTDGTLEMVKNFDVRYKLKYVRNPTNHGLCRTRNLGVVVAENDVVLFNDSDIVHTKDLILEHMVRHEQADNLVLTGMRSYNYMDGRPYTVSDLELSEPNLSSGLGLDEFSNNDERIFHTNGPPYNLVEATNGYKKLGRGRQINLSGGGAYGLSTMVIGHQFSASRLELIKISGNDEDFGGLKCDDSIIGAYLIANGNYVIPLPNSLGLHIDHPVRSDDNTQRNWDKNYQLLLAKMFEFPSKRTTTDLCDVFEFTSVAEGESNKIYITVIKQPDQKLTPDYFSRVKRNLKEEDYAAILQFSGKDISDPWGFYDLGVIYMENGIVDRALDCFKIADEMLPHDWSRSWTNYQLGVVNNKLGRIDEARKAFELSLAYDFNNQQAKAELGRM